MMSVSKKPSSSRYSLCGLERATCMCMFGVSLKLKYGFSQPTNEPISQSSSGRVHFRWIVPLAMCMRQANSSTYM